MLAARAGELFDVRGQGRDPMAGIEGLVKGGVK